VMFNVYTDDFQEGWAEMVYRIAHCSCAKFESTGRGDALAKGVNGVFTLTNPNGVICELDTTDDDELYCKKMPLIHPRNPQRNGRALNDYALSLIKGTPQYEKSRENVYAYGIRLHEYPASFGEDWVCDQIEMMRQKLRDNPYRRDIQAITWIPDIDGVKVCENPACLQRISVRQMSDDGGCRLRIDFRSNDTKAFLFNIVAIATMIDYEVMKPNGKYIKEIFYTSDNTHIYEDDWDAWAKFVRPARIS